jgi:hypothetical protein
MQNAAYTWFLEKSNNDSLTFQDVDKINSMLAKTQLPYLKLVKYDKGKL